MNLANRYTDRITASYVRIEDVFRHRDGGVVPFQVADVNYWLSGETPDLIPDDYFTDCASMLRYQAEKIERHMETYDDDYIPFRSRGTGPACSHRRWARRFSSSRKWTPRCRRRSSAAPSTSGNCRCPIRTRMG